MASCIPLGQRIRLYNRVLQLGKQGLSYGERQRKIYRLECVTVSKANISRWARGINSPLGKVNNFNPESTPTLAYIISVRLGDAYLYEYGLTHGIALEVVDYEFAAKTGLCLAELVGRTRPYKPWWVKSHRRWRVTGYSVLLYLFLQQPLEKLKPCIEHCKDCVASFLRGFFDSEGSINRRKLRAHNTSLDLLNYVRYLLRQYFCIETTHQREMAKAGRLILGNNGKVYKSDKACYYICLPVRSLPSFRRYVGFTIIRKQQRLIKAIKNNPSSPSFLLNEDINVGCRCRDKHLESGTEARVN